MSEQHNDLQLQMAWPEYLLHAPPAVCLTPGYLMRTYHSGDEDHFFKLMKLAGWSDWDEQRLEPWFRRLLPEGWIMVIHQVSGQMVASCMALRSEAYSSGGELGWLAGDPSHSGKELGLAVSAAVTARFIEEGYRIIHLYSEDYRLAALKIYLRLGYVPFLYMKETTDRWSVICDRLRWPFTPDKWKSTTKLVV